ncbi:AMP-binding protein [Pseudorhodobacter sp.]|uniref:AMP-binding protein n=1 Tax=Pseudorhodobacter sp. TaxID=1934400 RepID=UPI002AFDCD14|nr:AMP-binding protein [Pseudorhodobacter sp.]
MPAKMVGMTQRDLQKEMDRDGACIIPKLDQWARKLGDKPCLYYGEDDSTLSYADFGALTDQIAGNLALQGVKKGDFVSVFMGNAKITILSMFAIWKAGAVYCPINFGFRGDFLAYQINDTQPKLLITERAMVPRLNDIASELSSVEGIVIYDPPQGAHDFCANPIDLDSTLNGLPWEALLAATQRPDIEIRFDDVANVLYTSGTTGPSKGVVQTHRWMNQYTFMCRSMMAQDDILYNDLPLYHVGGAIFNVVRAIWMGCTVVAWDRFSTTDFWPRIRKTGASAASLIDTMIPWLLKANPTPDDRNNSLNKVHMQPLPNSHIEMAQRFGLDFISVGFGQTETGMSFFSIVDETEDGLTTSPDLRRGHSWKEMHDMAARLDIPFVKARDASTKGYMGIPSIFVEAAAFDEEGMMCAPGEIGELALRPKLPAMFFREYLRKPDATVKAFKNLWFHTGDTVRVDDTDAYTFMDRKGDRIRVRGENVSSFEVEDFAGRFSGVMASAAFAVPADIGEEDDIALCVEIKPGMAVSEDELRAWLAARMPKFMCPRYIRIVDAIPRTATQKIEKYKLKKMLLSELGKQ